MQFIVIDNDSAQTLRLTELLSAAYSNGMIFPEKVAGNRRTFSRWDDVHEFLNPMPEANVVLCLDLSLVEQDYTDAVRGLKQGQFIRAKKPGWVLVAYTQFGRRVESEALYNEAFDGMIEKADIDRQADREGCIRYVREAINAAIRKHYGTESIPADTRIIDSLGMRLFRAAFSDTAIAEIIRGQASDWSDVVVESLTTGHSGGFMLAIGGKAKGHHALILKVARSEDIIRAELEAQQKYLDQLGPLNGHLAQLDPKPKRFSSGPGVYYRQARIDGIPLLGLIKGKGWNKSREILEPVVRLCIEVCSSVTPISWSIQPARMLFSLSGIDIGRLEASTEFLLELGNTLYRRNLWPTSIGAQPSVVAKAVIDMVREWNHVKFTDLSLPTVVQHGDFNPGNVMITSSGPVLIDLQRLGPWPIGYDLSRLALMLRMRLLEAGMCRDWLPDGLKKWVSEPIAHLGKKSPVTPSLCKESIYCDQQFRNFAGRIPEHFELLVFGYRLGSLWDLIKVVSYQDLSPYKRMLALVECWRLGSNLAKDVKNLSTTAC